MIFSFFGVANYFSSSTESLHNFFNICNNSKFTYKNTRLENVKNNLKYKVQSQSTSRTVNFTNQRIQFTKT